MLEVLRVKNYAIIDEVEIRFGPALVTVTGETGAGKSILLGALKLLLGERATGGIIRSGAERSCIEAAFRVEAEEIKQFLDAMGLADEDDPSSLTLRRELMQNGNSRVFINGSPATLAQLRTLGEKLADLHAQNENATLYAQATQLELLDNFGKHGDLVSAYTGIYSDYTSCRNRVNELSQDNKDLERRKSFLQFQVDEIDSAQLKPGEDDELEAERRRLGNAEKLGAACRAACDVLYEGEASEMTAAAAVAAAAKALHDIASVDASQEPLLKSAEELRFAIEDLCERVREYETQVAADPARLSAVEDRLEVLRSLKRKYGQTLEQVIAGGEELRAELSSLINRDEALAEATAKLDKHRDDLLAAAAKLTKARKKTAERFAVEVVREMHGLELQKALFEVRFGNGQEENGTILPEQTGPTGADRIEFLVALNPGEGLKPLRKVASGGEIARIMLAIKSVLAECDRTPTLIFDEIDIGVSGEAAARVGEKLSALAKSHQVLCITHLPQIAARGDMHLVVRKAVLSNRTAVSVEPVEGKVRENVLAEMLSGRDVDNASLRFAKQLLERR